MLDKHEYTYRFIVWIRRQNSEFNLKRSSWIGAIHRVQDLSEGAFHDPPRKIYFDDMSKIQSAIERLIADESETL